MPRTAVRVSTYRRALVGFTGAETALVLSLKPPFGVRRSHRGTFPEHLCDLSSLLVSWNLSIPDLSSWTKSIARRCRAQHDTRYRFVAFDHELLERLFHMCAMAKPPGFSLVACFFLTMWFSDGTHHSWQFVSQLVERERLRRSRVANTVTEADMKYFYCGC